MARRARGTGRLLLAFAVGGAVILAAVRYMPGLSEVVVGTPSAISSGEHAPPGETRASRVAGRLSYELSASVESGNGVSEPVVSPPSAAGTPPQPKGAVP